MARNLADLKSLCKQFNLMITKTGKRESKADYEKALREFIWNRDNSGEEMPEQIAPMLARNSKDISEPEREEMFKDGSKWVAQEKINGCRCIMKIRKDGRPNHLISRRLSDETYRQNELHDQLPHYRDLDLGDEWNDTVVDGEILSAVAVVDTTILEDKRGVVTRDILQATAATLNCSSEKSIAIQKKFGRMVLHAFDLLRFKGRDVTNLPYCDPSNLSNTRTRYGLLMQVVERVVGVMGEMKDEYSEGKGLHEIEGSVEDLGNQQVISQEAASELL